MNITRENLDALNAVVKVDIVAEDYQPKVDKLLTDYRKKADVPGFRKGHVPMGMIKKQYGQSIMIDIVRLSKIYAIAASDPSGGTCNLFWLDM